MAKRVKKYPLGGYAINEIPVNGRNECFEIIEDKFATKVRLNVSMFGAEECDDGEERYYYWYFDDPYATKDNPNVYVTSNPEEIVEHIYNYSGKYTIHFIEILPESGKVIERTFPIDIENGSVKGLTPEITLFQINKVDDEGHYSITLSYDNPGREIIDIVVRVYNNRWELVKEQHNNLNLELEDGYWWIEVGIENEYCLWDWQVKSLKVDTFKIYGCEWEVEDNCIFIPGKRYRLKVIASGHASDLEVVFDSENVLVDKVGEFEFDVVFPDFDGFEKTFNFTITGKGKTYDCSVIVRNVKGGFVLGNYVMIGYNSGGWEPV